jgi:hypothetical protein
MIETQFASRVHRLALGAFLLVAGAACRDELTTPADCPSLCPGGQPQVVDTVLTATLGGDSTYIGYVAAGLGPSLRVSNGLPVSEDRALTVFLPRPDSIAVDGAPRAVIRLDSAIIGVTLQARDTNVTGLKLFLYNLTTDSADLDTTTTFADVEPRMVQANLIDSIVVPDSVKSGLLRLTVTGADTARIGADSTGRFEIGIKMTANAPTGVRLASIAASGSPSVTHFVHVEIADTNLAKQTFSRFPSFTTFVSQTPPPFNVDLLGVGGAPSARSLLRFSLPRDIRDSVTILRATLELTPDATLLGLPNDKALLQAFGVIGDLGAKSPVITSGSTIGLLEVQSGTSDTLSVDITRLVRAWQGENGIPQLVFLALAPEAASFTQGVFRSTRSPAGGAPRLRLTYFRKFPFEVP